MTKVFATEAYQKATTWFQQMAGPCGLLGLHEPGAAADGWIDHDTRHSPLTTIAGGTTEINRNNVGEHGLGLPNAALKGRRRLLPAGAFRRHHPLISAISSRTVLYVTR